VKGKGVVNGNGKVKGVVKVNGNGGRGTRGVVRVKGKGVVKGKGNDNNMIKKFLDLKVWHKAHEMTLFVYSMTKSYPKDELYSLVNQMRRCAVSISANIAEGSKKRTTADLLHFLNISEGSLEELKYYGILSRDLGYIDKSQYEQLMKRSESTGIMLERLKQSLNHRKAMGIFRFLPFAFMSFYHAVLYHASRTTPLVPRFLLSVILGFSILYLGSHASYAAFKDEGWGARPLGMAGAFSSVADDVNAPLFNPAGTAQLMQDEISFTYARLFLGLDLQGTKIYTNYLAYAKPTLRWGSFGLVWTNQTVTSLYKEDTYVLNYAHSVNQYFTNLPFELLLGANLKYLSNTYTLGSSIVNADDPVFRNGRIGRAYTFDFGLLFNLERNSLGFSAKNINSPDIGLFEEDRVPREFIVGFSRYYFDFWVFEEAFPSLDISYRDEIDRDLQIKVGGEGWLWNNTVALRAGAIHSRSLTLGLTYNSRQLIERMEFQTDYAFLLPLTVEENSGSHRFSMTLRFGGPKGKMTAKAVSTEFMEEKMRLLWDCYVALVEKGGSLENRKKFLTKFINRYRYSGLDISFAEEEYSSVVDEMSGRKTMKKINSILNR
jgi:four helix bundle protein